jgi:hypothetical protein
MSEHQTLSMLVNETEHRTNLQITEFKEHSIQDETIILNDLGHGAKEMREQALAFLGNYKKID